MVVCIPDEASSVDDFDDSVSELGDSVSDLFCSSTFKFFTNSSNVKNIIKGAQISIGKELAL